MTNRRSVFIEDAATILGISKRTVYNLIREGWLKTEYVGDTQRVLFESIEKLPSRQERRKAKPVNATLR